MAEPPLSYPSGESYQRYENNVAKDGRDYSMAEYAARSLKGVGRPASRHRQYMKALRARIDEKQAVLACGLGIDIARYAAMSRDEKQAAFKAWAAAENAAIRELSETLGVQ